jgi:plastocyanin
MKNLVAALFGAIIGLTAVSADEVEDSKKPAGTITGTIKARGVRDARDVVVYLENVEGIFEPSEEKPVVDQKNLIFIPHILPVLKGTTVQFSNSDSVQHNVFSPSKCCKFNLGTYGAGIVREVAFDKTGFVALLCNVHAEMSAFIVVLQNPYFELTGPDGIFTIKDVPPGTYTLKTWHQKLKGKKQEVTVIEGDSVAVDFKLSR